MVNKNKLFLFMMIFILALSVSQPVFAMDKNILNEKSTTLPVNEKVDNVIILGHDIDIKGKVDTSAIVINGNMHIAKTAKINGLVLVINGNVKQEPGSYVRENILAFKFTNDTINHLLIGAAILLGTWLIQFVLSIGFVFLAVLIGLLFKNKGTKDIDFYKQQAGKLILAGAVASVALTGVISLLIITVFGIPLAILLAIPPLVFLLIGLALLSRMIGERLLEHREWPHWLKNLAGAFVLISAFNFPFFGMIIFLAVFWFSTGFMVVMIKEKWLKKRG